MIAEPVRQLLDAAQAALSRLDCEAALALYAQAAALDPEGHETQYAVGTRMNASPLGEFAEPYLRRAWELSGDTDAAATLAKALQRTGCYEEALALLAAAADDHPQRFLDGQFERVDCLYRLGRLNEATALADSLNAFALTHALAFNEDDPFQLLWPSDMFRKVIGEVTLRFDTVIKAMGLGLVPNLRPRLLQAADLAVANPALLDYFAEKLPVTVLPDGPYRFLTARHGHQKFNTSFWVLPGLGGGQLIPTWSRLNQLWWEQGRPPVLALRPAHREEGRRIMEGLGLPPGTWFTVLHVRAPGSHRDMPWTPAALRSADIETTLPAIRAVTARGGWVVRLGDPSMPPLAPMQGVIDYACSPVRCDWMDLYLCAEAKFAIGMASGISQLPVVFGVPLVLVNGFSLGPLPVGPESVYIHKRVRTTEGRSLTIREMFTPPVLNQYHPFFFERQGLEVVDNTADEIMEAVVEMMDLVENRLAYDGADEDRWARYQADADYYGYGLVGRVSKYFLQKYESLLAPNKKRAAPRAAPEG